jgi:hypothetical protein
MPSNATITTTTAAQFIPTLWSAGTLNAIEFAARLQKRVNTSYKSELKVGNTLTIPRVSNLSTQTKSSGVSSVVVFEAITETSQTITVSTHEYAAFLLEDIAKVQAKADIRSKYEKKIGYALARGREVTLFALAASLSQVVGTLGTELSSDDYLAGYQKLIEAGLLEDDMSPDDQFSIFLSPAAWIGALKVDVFTNRQYNTEGDAIQRAKIGNIYGMPVYTSNLVTASGAGHNNLMMHRDCFALIVQEEVPVRAQYKIDNLADAVVGWNVYGVAEMNYPPETPGGSSAVDNRGVLLRSV